MTSPDIEIGQKVCIPAIRLTGGAGFAGYVTTTNGPTVIIETDEALKGALPIELQDRYELTWEVCGQTFGRMLVVHSVRGRAIVGQLEESERRDSPRIRVDMDLSYQVVAPEKVDEAAAEVMAHITASGQAESEALRWSRNQDDPVELVHQEVSLLRDMMLELMNKMDELAHALAHGKSPDLSTHMKRPIRILDCSGTGLGFTAADPYQEGSCLRLWIKLKGIPPICIECLGRVMRCRKLEGRSDQKSTERYSIGVHFTHIHENDREKLIQYLFRVQRQLLRDRRHALEAQADG